MPEPRLDAKITADNTQFMRGLRQSTEAAKKTGASMAASFTKVAGLFGVGVGVGSIVYGIQQTAQELSKMRDLTDRFGGNVETFQKMAQVFKENGVNTDELGNAMTRLTRKTAEAVAGNAGLQEAFAALNIDVEKFAQLAPSEQMFALSDAIAASEDKSMALKDAFKILEDDAKKLFPLMNQGAENLREQMEGVVAVSEETIDSYKRASETVDRFFTNLQRKAISALAYVVETNSFLANNPDATIGDHREFLADMQVRQGREANLELATARRDSIREQLRTRRDEFGGEIWGHQANDLIRELKIQTATIKNLNEQLARAGTEGGYTTPQVQEAY